MMAHGLGSPMFHKKYPESSRVKSDGNCSISEDLWKKSLWNKALFCVAFVSDSAARQAVLRGELERHSVPYYMVRTKVDQDIANNKEEPWMGQLSESTPRNKDLILGPHTGFKLFWGVNIHFDHWVLLCFKVTWPRADAIVTLPTPLSPSPSAARRTHDVGLARWPGDLPSKWTSKKTVSALRNML